MIIKNISEIIEDHINDPKRKLPITPDSIINFARNNYPHPILITKSQSEDLYTRYLEGAWIKKLTIRSVLDLKILN